MTTVDTATEYRAVKALPVRTEMVRQFGRPRTRATLSLMVAMPLIILAAFQFNGGQKSDGSQIASQFADLGSLATTGGLNFAVFVLFSSSWLLFGVIAAMFCGDAIAGDASNGTLRYLLAMPVPRGRLLGVKLLVALTYTAAAVLLLVCTALAAGAVRYGWHPLNSTMANEVPAGQGLLRLAMAVTYILITVLPVASGAFLLSVRMNTPLGAVGGAVLTLIMSSIIDQVGALGGLRTVLPTHFNDAWLGLLANEAGTENVARGCVTAVCYAAVFCFTAWWSFLRKDMVD